MLFYSYGKPMQVNRGAVRRRGASSSPTQPCGWISRAAEHFIQIVRKYWSAVLRTAVYLARATWNWVKPYPYHHTPPDSPWGWDIYQTQQCFYDFF